MKKNKNNGNIIILIIIYFVCFIFIGTAYSFFSEQLELKSTAGISINQDEEYEVDYILQSNWESDGYYFYHYNVNITYTGNDTINSWQLNVLTPSITEVNGCYNASECVLNDTTLKITNASWNGNMTNGTVVTPSFIIKTTDSNYVLEILSINFNKENQTEENPSGGEEPDDGKEEEKPTEPIEPIEPQSGITATLSEKNNWGTVTQFDLEIVNNSDVTLTSWELKYEVPEGTKVTNIWGGNYILKENILIITGSEWNKMVEANTTNSSVGFQIETPTVPANLKLISFKGTNSNQEEVEIEI